MCTVRDVISYFDEREREKEREREREGAQSLYGRKRKWYQHVQG